MENLLVRMKKREVKDTSFMCSLSQKQNRAGISKAGDAWERSKFEVGGS